MAYANKGGPANLSPVMLRCYPSKLASLLSETVVQSLKLPQPLNPRSTLRQYYTTTLNLSSDSLADAT